MIFPTTGATFRKVRTLRPAPRCKDVRDTGPRTLGHVFQTRCERCGKDLFTDDGRESYALCPECDLLY